MVFQDLLDRAWHSSVLGIPYDSVHYKRGGGGGEREREREREREKERERERE